MLLALARRFVAAQQAVRAGGWDAQVAFGTPRLRGRTLGIVGCGRIGSAIALRAKVLGMRVVICDPYKPHGIEKALAGERGHLLDVLLRHARIDLLDVPVA